LDEKDQAILTALTENGMITSDIAKVIGLTPRATRTRLAKLIDRGLVREVGTSPRDPKRRYFPAG
jgi:DNA-binding Lrp family transcriptional regulator